MCEPNRKPSSTEVFATLQQRIATAIDPDSLMMSIDEVSAYTGISRGQLAQLRFRGTGPAFLKPSSRTVIYVKKFVDDWLKGCVTTRTGEADEAEENRRSTMARFNDYRKAMA